MATKKRPTAASTDAKTTKPTIQDTEALLAETEFCRGLRGF